MFAVELRHIFGRHCWAHDNPRGKFVAEKANDFFGRKSGPGDRQRHSRHLRRQLTKCILEIKNPTLVQPGSGIQQTQVLSQPVLPRSKKSLINAIRNVRAPFRRETIFELQNIPHIAAENVRGVRRPDRPAKPRKMIDAVPQSILPAEIPRLPFLCFAPHHPHSSLLQPVQRHYIGWTVSGLNPSAQPIHQPGRRMQIHQRKLSPIPRNIARQASGKNQFTKARRNRARSH
jgi:hypothetical protein